MAVQQALRCRCGKVTGHVTDPSPESCNRIVCHCSDCQAYLHHLGRADLLDAHGGTDIVQVAPATVTIVEGSDSIRCVRLTAKGMYRWFAGCCMTPMGNTLGPGVPFIGIVHGFIDKAGDDGTLDRVFGPPRALMHGREAVGAPPPNAHPKAPLAIIGRLASLLVRWKLGGKGSPSPFFDSRTKEPVCQPTILPTSEREALRRAHGSAAR